VAESVLDTVFLDLLGTLKDKSKGEIGSGGKKEEFKQSKIDTSTFDHKLSTKHITDSSILIDTSPVDEHHMEVEPSRHMK